MDPNSGGNNGDNHPYQERSDYSVADLCKLASSAEINDQLVAAQLFCELACQGLQSFLFFLQVIQLTVDCRINSSILVVVLIRRKSCRDFSKGHVLPGETAE